jgi:hypothetical protein
MVVRLELIARAVTRSMVATHHGLQNFGSLEYFDGIDPKTFLLQLVSTFVPVY